jgi:hypothetical protein
MRLEQIIREKIIAESADMDSRLQQLVRAGLMPQSTLPILRKSIAKVQNGMALQGPERDVMATFINSMMYIVLGDDAIFSRARAGARGYAAEEIELEEGQKPYVSASPGGIGRSAEANVLNSKGKTSMTFTKKEHGPDYMKKANAHLKKHYNKLMGEEVEQVDEGSYKDNPRHMGTIGPITTDAERKERARKYREKMKKEEVEQLDELSPERLTKYKKQAEKQSGKLMKTMRKHFDKADRVGFSGRTDAAKSEKHTELGRAAYGKALKRSAGAAMASKKLAKEEVEQIDELSKDTLGRYIKKAATKIGTQGVTAGMKIAKDERSQKNFDTIAKRERGIGKAVKKLTKEDIDAVKKMNESYKTEFDTALTKYGIKSPSELDESKRKEFFNYVDQQFKKGDN